MKIDILTLFPEFFHSPFNSSILKRANEKELFTYNLINYRDFSTNKHQKVDDYPYGGGAGMVLTAQPIFDAVEHVTRKDAEKPRIILMCPQGERYSQQKAEQLSEEEHLIIICGHYEGYDERIRSIVTDEISIGDYVLTGGEIGALTVIDSVVRLLPDVLGNKESARLDSFSTGLLEHPQYTRPAVYKDMAVPDVLMQGHHAQIERWRMKESLRRTYERRPDLLETLQLSEAQEEILAEVINEINHS